VRLLLDQRHLLWGHVCHLGKRAPGKTIMGYNPRDTGKGAFSKCDNTLLLAERLRMGTADLNRIEEQKRERARKGRAR
jgi:hypothetical protein